MIRQNLRNIKNALCKRIFLRAGSTLQRTNSTNRKLSYNNETATSSDKNTNSTSAPSNGVQSNLAPNNDGPTLAPSSGGGTNTNSILAKPLDSNSDERKTTSSNSSSDNNNEAGGASSNNGKTESIHTAAGRTSGEEEETPHKFTPVRLEFNESAEKTGEERSRSERSSVSPSSNGRQNLGELKYQKSLSIYT